MAEPKRGSVEAFKAAEKRRQERLKKPSLKKTDAKKEAFNKKVASINKSRTNQDSVSKFKAAEERRKARVASVNKINPNSPKAKRIVAKRAEADVEKDLPKSKISTATAVGTAVGTAAGKIASQAKKVSTKTKPLPKAKPDLKSSASSFGEAFKKARAQGVGTKFAYNDKQYAAVTRDDISRAGKSSLQDFLNSAKRKDTKIAKAPGQIVKKQSGGMIAQTPQGGMSPKEKRDRIRNMIASARAGSETIREGGMREDRLKSRLKQRADQAEERNMRLKERSGSAVSDREMKSIIEQMGRSPAEDRMKTGGSVMARGCKLGRKKPTKMY